MTTPISGSDSAGGVESSILLVVSHDVAQATESVVRAGVVDALAFWQATYNVPAPVGFFHWGSVPAGSSADLQFRVKNTSTLLTANGVTVSVTGSGSGAANPANLHLLSYDGLVFTASITIGSLPPGGLSLPVTLRRVVPYGASLGAGSFSVVASLGSWTSDLFKTYAWAVGP